MKIIPIHDITVTKMPEGGTVSNFPRNLFIHSDDYSWGYGGSGPNELAVNILYYFTNDKYFSERYRVDFVRHFLIDLSVAASSIVIPAMEIQLFLLKRVSDYDKKFQWDLEAREETK